jgi:hypothetical protein
MVDARTLRGGSIADREDLRSWGAGLRGLRALSIWFPDVMAEIVATPATRGAVMAAALQFAYLLPKLLIVDYDFAEHLEYRMDWDEMEQQVIGQELAEEGHPLLEHERVGSNISDWLDNPPLAVFGFPHAIHETTEIYHGIAAACWVPFRQTMVHLIDDLADFEGVPSEILDVVEQMPTIQPLSLEALRDELNRTPILGCEEFGDVLVYMLKGTGNQYADLSSGELDEGGGWQDCLNWEDQEYIQSLRDQQDEANAWSLEAHKLGVALHDDPGLIIDLMLHIYGAAAVIRARIQQPRTLMEVYGENTLV